MILNKEYQVNFVVDCKGYHSEFNGFENEATAGFFEPGWNMSLLFHDMFEHWFEGSHYFNTGELSQAGECVAMGIRAWFFDNYYMSAARKYAGYNKHNGPEWSSWSAMLNQVQESYSELKEDGYTKYPNNFKYTHLSDWDGENIFEGYASTYAEGYQEEIVPLYGEQIETAHSYGYWLGQYMFEGREDQIDTFCDNLEIILETIGILDLGLYESPLLPIHGERLTFRFTKDNIIAKFCGCYITANQGEVALNRSIKQFLNKFELDIPMI